MEEKYFTLNNDVELPVIGFGTYKAVDGSGEEIIDEALRAGYRYFDTAAYYKNEEEIGNALTKSGIAREELFLASKVWKGDMGYESTKKALEESLRNLKTDYLDLYLIHWPKKSPEDQSWKEEVQQTWKAMEELQAEGKIRALGLSNFLPHHIEAILETAVVRPSVVQLELHVGYLQSAAVAYCQEQGIQVQAWSPLGRARVMNHPVVAELAAKYEVSPAQLLLGFLYQLGIAVIPKASSYERMIANRDIYGFTLSKEDLYFLRCMPQTGWSGEHPDFERVRF